MAHTPAQAFTGMHPRPNFLSHSNFILILCITYAKTMGNQRKTYPFYKPAPSKEEILVNFDIHTISTRKTLYLLVNF